MSVASDYGIRQLESRMNNCFHCGTVLVPWNPAVYKDGVEVSRQETSNKWCPNCLFVVAHQLRSLLTGPHGIRENWAGSGNYTADREVNPTSVTFANGRRVFLNSEGFLDVETVNEPRLADQNTVHDVPRRTDA